MAGLSAHDIVSLNAELGTHMSRKSGLGQVLYCGDPHGRFRHIIEAAGHTKASAVVLLGDMEPTQPLHLELAPILARKIPVYFIHGNHDADSDELATRVWQSELAGMHVHGRVGELPDGTRLAGLGGVFRKAVWYPANSSALPPAFRSRREHAKSTPQQDQWQGGPHRRHLATIYPDELDGLADLRADVLITHEAPGYHPYGFDLLDTLAQAMGVKVTVHGHQHDQIDSSSVWATQGFKSFGCGLRGISAIDLDGNATVVVPGERDEARGHRQGHFDALKTVV